MKEYYSAVRFSSKNTLMHKGIIGMRWGHHKDDEGHGIPGKESHSEEIQEMMDKLKERVKKNQGTVYKKQLINKAKEDMRKRDADRRKKKTLEGYRESRGFEGDPMPRSVRRIEQRNNQNTKWSMDIHNRKKRGR